MLSGDQILNNVTFNTNEYSFVDILASFINNREFSNGYIQSKADIDSKQAYIWRALSAIGQEVGEVTYENVLNYIDRVANIDLCKVRSLKSIVKSLGVNFTILDNINVFPEDIIKMIDVLSINKKYILNNKTLKSILCKDILSETLTEPDNSSIAGVVDISSFSTPSYITPQKYEDYITKLFKNHISSVINMTYCSSDKPIWQEDSNEIVDGFIDTEWETQLIQFKHKYNIPNNFKQSEIVDNIDKGIDSIDNYNGYYKDLINLEIEHRNKPLKNNENKLVTRYSYYRKQKVKEYIQFIEQQYNGLGQISGISKNVYEIDGNYFELSSIDFEHLIERDKYSLSSFTMNDNMIDEIAKTIAKLTINISRLRDSLKTQTQKIYAKGTFNLLAFLINEYLIEYSRSRVLEDADIASIRSRLSNHSIDAVKLIEYIDTTEYFNIRTKDSRNAYNRSKVNDRYWEGETDQNTNSGFAFKDNDISTFYINRLNVKVDNLNHFLCNLFELGATKTYISQDEQSLCASTNNDNMFLTYNGTKYGLNPIFNIKNKTHSSYQVHPYLKNFIEYTGITFPILNGFYNDTVDNLEDELVLGKLSNYIGEFGQVINVASNNSYDFSGYRSRYETYPHGGQDEIFGYDGIFYPPAIQDFVSDTDNFINQVKTQSRGEIGEVTYYEKYYEPLNLTHEEYERIADQLSSYRDLITEIATSETYDVFKYGKDKFDNAYILLKNYPKDTQYVAKVNTPGQLWIKKTDHPIALPAFYGNDPQFETTDEVLNQNFKMLAKSDDMKTDPSKMSYIYDIDFSSTKDTLFVMAYPVNDDGFPKDELFKDIQHCKIIISNIEEDFDVKEKKGKLFVKATDTSFVESDMYKTFKDDLVSGYTFLGLYKNGVAISPLFIKKTYDKIEGRYVLSEIPDVKIRTYVDGIQEGEEIITSLDISGEYYNYNGDIKFVQNGTTLTFVVLKSYNRTSQIVQNYIGLDTEYGKVDHLSASRDIEDDSSSLDRLNQFIYIADTKLVGTDLLKPTCKIYNLNSDASYIPQYSGQIGLNDVSRSTYKNNKINNIELLGHSFNNIDYYIGLVNPDANPNINIEDLKDKYLYGSVYEDYNEDEDKSIREFNFNQFNEGKLSGIIRWKTSLKYLPENERDKSFIILYNTNTGGKNPYYIGPLSSISSTSDRGTSLVELGNYNQESEFRDISSIDPLIKITGTYNSFDGKINRNDSNNLYNVKDIEIKYTDSQIIVDFLPIDYYKPYVIRKNTVRLYVCNESDLKIFEKYHLLEPINLNIASLSDYELSDYDNLSDVPVLSGTDKLQFKNHEQDIFDLSSKLYYFPMINVSYPIRPVNVLDYKTPEKSIMNLYNMNDIYSQNNLFVFKVDNNEILNKVGKIEIPINIEAEDSFIVDESYLSDDNYNKVDPDSSDIAKYIMFMEDEESTYDVDFPAYSKHVSLTSFLETLESECNISASMTEELQSSKDFNYYITEQTVDTLGYSDDLFNIYVNYKTETDGSITLYFNYVNYLNTPFVKIEDGVQRMYTVPGSYLKLKGSTDGKGQEGILNIYTQYKYYNDQISLAGVSTVKLVSYKIYNVSDDKPKFLIQKISEVMKDSNKHKPVNGQLSIIGSCDDVIIDRLNLKDQLSINLNIDIIANKEVNNGQYFIRYQNSKLSTVIDPTGSGQIVIDEFTPKTIVFKSKTSFGSLIASSNTNFIFRLKAGHIYDNDRLEFETYANKVQLNPRYDVLLRQESTDPNMLVLTENSLSILIK